jgi:hypothetical protein
VGQWASGENLRNQTHLLTCLLAHLPQAAFFSSLLEVARIGLGLRPLSPRDE